MIEFKLDLSAYSPGEIIQLHKEGLLTLDEIVDSGRAYTCFGDELHQYVKRLRLQQPTRLLTRHA